MNSQSSRALKSISLQFRTLASSALRSNSDDARVNIRRLLAFVDATPLLRAEIDRAPASEADFNDLWQNARGSRGRLSFPDDPLEELGLLHGVLTELARETKDEFFQRCYLYGGQTKIQECVTEALSDTVGRYSNHLRQTLELALLDSSDPAYESRRVEVHVSGGTNQVNLAQDQGRIHAQQVSGADAAAVIECARLLAREAAGLFEQTGNRNAEQVEEIATAVVQAMEQPKPSRFTLRKAMDELPNLSAAATLGVALAPQAARLVDLIAKFIGG
jgi:hypothetical protein